MRAPRPRDRYSFNQLYFDSIHELILLLARSQVSDQAHLEEYNLFLTLFHIQATNGVAFELDSTGPSDVFS